MHCCKKCPQNLQVKTLLQTHTTFTCRIYNEILLKVLNSWNRGNVLWNYSFWQRACLAVLYLSSVISFLHHFMFSLKIVSIPIRRRALADVQSTLSALCSKKVQFLSTVLSGGEIWEDLILVYLDNCSTNIWKYTFICLHLTSTYLGNCSTFQIGSPDFPLPWQLQYKGMKACFHIALPDFHEFMYVIVPTSTW